MEYKIIMSPILFIGLGNMGLPMAINLIKKGYKVYGYDLFDSAKKMLEQQGGFWVSDLSSQANQFPIVISMLPGGKEIEDLYLNKQKLFDVLKKETLIIDCTTSNPEMSLKISQQAETLGFKMLDAPVSGGTTGAQQATLTFIVGGKEAHFKEAQPYFLAMGKNIFHAGKAGSGQAVKVCNNMLLAIHMIGTSEALALGQKMGLDVKVLSKIMKSSSGNNWSLEKYNPCQGIMENVPSSHDYKAGFSVKLMLKDLSLAMQSAKSYNQKLELGKQAFALYEKHFKDGFDKKDFSHIFKIFNS